jgi:hypothetical protein
MKEKILIFLFLFVSNLTVFSQQVLTSESDDDAFYHSFHKAYKAPFICVDSIKNNYFFLFELKINSQGALIDINTWNKGNLWCNYVDFKNAFKKISPNWYKKFPGYSILVPILLLYNDTDIGIESTISTSLDYPFLKLDTLSLKTKYLRPFIMYDGKGKRIL